MDLIKFLNMGIIAILHRSSIHTLHVTVLYSDSSIVSFTVPRPSFLWIPHVAQERCAACKLQNNVFIL